MKIDGKSQPMDWNSAHTTMKFSMDEATSSHATLSTTYQNLTVVYAGKPLIDKDFTPSWAKRPVCYTWHTLRRPGGQIHAERSPG